MSYEIKDIRKKYGINVDDFVVLGAGQVQNRKGVLDFAEVARKLPDITFIWAGGFSFGAITDGHNELKKDFILLFFFVYFKFFSQYFQHNKTFRRCL